MQPQANRGGGTSTASTREPLRLLPGGDHCQWPRPWGVPQRLALAPVVARRPGWRPGWPHLRSRGRVAKIAPRASTTSRAARRPRPPVVAGGGGLRGRHWSPSLTGGAHPPPPPLLYPLVGGVEGHLWGGGDGEGASGGCALTARIDPRRPPEHTPASRPRWRESDGQARARVVKKRSILLPRIDSLICIK